MKTRDKLRTHPDFQGSGGNDYKVGYARPPAATQFKKGQSGNPHGRPRGSRNKRPALNEERMKSIIIEEAYRTINVNDGDRKVTIPMVQAIIRSLALTAVKGQQRAQRLFTELLAMTEGANKRLHDEWLETAIEYKVSWERELARRAASRRNRTEPLPHPDDIIIDMNTGLVRITGPMTKEDKAVWDECRRRKAECDQTIAEHEQLLRDNPNHEHKHFLLEDLEHERRLRATISRVIRD